MRKTLSFFLLILLCPAIAFATWESQGYTADTSLDGTEKVFLENGAGTANNFFVISNLPTYLEGFFYTESEIDTALGLKQDTSSLETDVEAVVDLQDLQGAVTDAQVPDDITITETDPTAEPALGNPASDGYVLSSTSAGVRSWVENFGSGSTELDALTDVTGEGTTDYMLYDDGDGTYSFRAQPSGAAHDAVTLGTANGLSLSTQELSLAAATNSSAGAATAAHITAIEANTAKVTFPGFTDLSTDYSFTDNSINWNTAYGWGDHSAQNYLDFDTYPNADTDSTDDFDGVFGSLTSTPTTLAGYGITDAIGTGGDIGAATATTPAEGDNDTSVATTAYVQTEIADFISASDGTTVSTDVEAMLTAANNAAIRAAIDLEPGTDVIAVGGNAATATALETARTIGGVSFDGSANIDLPGVNTTGNQDTTGNAATATLATTATTANAGDSATSFFSTGTLERARLPVDVPEAPDSMEIFVLDDCSTATGMVTGDICLEF